MGFIIKQGKNQLFFTIMKPTIMLFALFVLISYAQTPDSIDAVPFADTDNHGFQADGSMDLTFSKSTQQKNAFMQSAVKIQPGTNFLQHLFESDGDDEFHFTLPVEQQIAFYVYVYVVDDDQYVRTKDVSVEEPVLLTVYEGVDMIVKSSFYFQNYVVFNGKKDVKYTIKVQTKGNKKLLSLSLKLFVEQADIRKNLKNKQTQKYSLQTQSLKSQLSELANKFGVYWIIDENNMRHSTINVRRYLWVQLLEMAVLALASYLQIRTLYKLLKTNQIIV